MNGATATTRWARDGPLRDIDAARAPRPGLGLARHRRGGIGHGRGPRSLIYVPASVARAVPSAGGQRTARRTSSLPLGAACIERRRDEWRAQTSATASVTDVASAVSREAFYSAADCKSGRSADT